jgi:two-component system phosphate regulon sensor histidine kinase PhoR
MAITVLIIWTKIREADILKFEFMNVVTHKFRTPLTSIKWTMENLRESVPDALKNDIQQIQTANEHLMELTDTLVNLSSTDDKTYEYTLKETDIGSILNDCVTNVEDKMKAKGLTLSYISQPFIPVVADGQKIRFIFQTLLDNAVSYSPSGGKVSLEVKEIDGRFSRNNISIKVSDTGIGIPKDELRFIFTKFYRAKNGRKADTEGMGIGLYLSKRIIERHKGKMWVESAGEGKGTTFTIILPLAR